MATWDKLPQETAKAYAAFQIYLSLSVFGQDGERRSLENTAKKLGLRSTTSVERWSAKYDWVERAKAYDAYMGTTSITVKETALAEYQQAVVSSLSAQLVVLNNILDKTLADMLEGVKLGVPIDTKDLARIVRSVRDKDDLARRLGGMPTNYVTERADETEDEDTIFLIG